MLSLQTSYGKKEFWEERYLKEKEQFDWLQRFNPPTGNTVWRDIIMKCVADQAKAAGQILDHYKEKYKILVVGCGISRTSEDLWDEGFREVTSIDFSFTAIQFQQDFYRQEYPKLVFQHMDVRNMSFKDNMFDMVIDKACLDAVICSDGNKANAQTMIAEIYRVLKNNGFYICLSHGKENQRMKYLTSQKFKIEMKDDGTHAHRVPKEQIGTTSKTGKSQDPEKAKFHFCYVCHKTTGPIDNQSPPKKANQQPPQQRPSIARQPSLSAGRANSVKSNNSGGSYTPKQAPKE